ncbi:MAG TPA: tRNA 2-thiouridine(34) synthase MnmA [Candidatus Saccharimonadia bacterium]|jgi:tRNA-specific 2-thiouridylase|nr:tRNA 2-thiouridine(34) synthase MnmA [Candidatus Saccharimonadia bacterium]
MKSQTVYVGMSGGVDSSVSAALLKEQGYNVVGVYMKNWTQDVAGVACPWKQDLADARAAAAKLDIPFKVFDFQDEYKHHVVDVMVAEYQAGRTPNPDVLCNQEIKFNLFLKAALADGADLIATGHYAGTKDGKLLRAADANKDQTYFLYRVTTGALEKTIFPLAGLTKPEVRRLAEKFGLPTAKKPDSQGICFVGEVGLREFLKQYLEAGPGPIVDGSGARLGMHEGAIFYTIGQRHGLGVGGGQPYYVTGKDMSTNTVYVTTEPADPKLATSIFDLAQTNWINHEPKSAHQYQVRTRHRAELIPAQLTKTARGYRVELAHAERAITPGQSAVIYDGSDVVGGGIIV